MSKLSNAIKIKDGERMTEPELSTQPVLPRNPIMHKLKLRKEFFEHVECGDKSFEFRRGNRDFQIGDHLKLCEFDQGIYTGRYCFRRITYVLRIQRFQDGANYVCMSMIPL